MAEHEYYEVNGRQIRVRPTESGQEIDEYGNFHRQPNHFTKGFGEGENPVEADRYILFWGKGCNWSNRASIARELLGLDKAIKVEIVDWGDYEKPLGWEFVNSPDHINKETGAQFLSELYYNADDDYEGRTTVPALVDYKEKKVVNNDYHHLTNHFETAFKPLHKKGAPDLYPEELREEIDKLNVWLFENVNNAVYRAQFAESLQAFKDGYETFFAGLEAMDKRLENQRFLFGDYITDSDIRLYTTLARFDYSYSRNIGPCVHRLVDYKNLWPYARDLYQIPAFRHNTYFKDFAASEDLTHPELVGEVLDTIKKAANEGYTMLLVSHEMNFVKNVATRVIFLENGKIIEDGPPKEVFNHPKSDRVREFFAKINRMVEPEYSI